MTFSYVNLNTISNEEYDYLQKMTNKWIDKDALTQVYVVKDQDDIKSIFCLKQYGNYTEMELYSKTKENERRKGYCTFGFYMMMEIIKNNPSIKQAEIYAVSNVTEKLCQKNKIPPIYKCVYCFSNPNFNSKYDDLEKMIRSGTSLEELLDFCDDDEVMINILDIWLRKDQEENKSLSYR